MKTTTRDAFFFLLSGRGILLMTCWLMALTVQAQTIRYVKAGAGGGGSSWADASGDLRAMIAASNANDQVWVAQGTYKPTTNPTDRAASFAMRNGVTIYGGFPATGNPGLADRNADPEGNGTILSGDIDGDGTLAGNSQHVFFNPEGIDPTAVLDGFVITGGNAEDDQTTRFSDRAGGMLNYNCSPTIRNASFVGNTATSEGGAMGNYAYGGGIEVSPTLTNIVFRNNTVPTNRGGAITNTANIGEVCNPQLTDCFFYDNSARSGGAIWNGRSNPVFTNCLFQGNTASNTGGVITGGIIGNGYISPKFINCSFQGNRAGNVGGVMINGSNGGTSSPQFTNCSFQGNMATNGGSVLDNSGIGSSSTSQPRFTNCVLSGNGGSSTFLNEIYTGANAGITLTYSLVETSVTNYTDGGNNLTVTATPFASTTGTELAPGSPAIDAGDPATTTATVGTTDLAGNPRFVGGRIDMGAYEFAVFDCPTLAATTPLTYTICSGDNTSAISVSSTRNDLDVELVYFTAATATPYTGGTAVGTSTTPVGGGAPYEVTFSSLGFPANNTTSPVKYFVYALLDTDDADLTQADCRPSVAFEVTVNPLPTASIVNNNSAICTGSDATFTVSGTDGATLTYTLTGQAGNQTLALNGGNQTITASNATSDVTLTLISVTKDNCPATLLETSTVAINPSPMASIVTNNSAICAGSDATFTVSGTDGATLTYTLTGQAGNQILALNGTNQTISANNATFDATLTLVSVGLNSCVADLSETSTVTVNPLPTVDAGPDKFVYLGYGSTCTDLMATATGTPTLSYAWDMGAGNGATVNVCPEATTTYTVTVTDGKGCQATDQLTVTVQDVRCGNNNDKVLICHNGKELCISVDGVADHLAHGDVLGGCGNSASRIGYETETTRLPLQLTLKAYPNPVQNAVTVEVLSPSAGTANFEVLDLIGRALQSQTQDLVEGVNEVQFRLGSLPDGIYLIRGVDALNRQGVVRVVKKK